MQKNTVCLTMEDAKQIYELFNACALADLHYHTCQSELFRRHVCSTPEGFTSDSYGYDLSYGGQRCRRI